MVKSKSEKIEKKYDIIIVGGGSSAMSAGIYAARQKIKTLVVTREIGGQLSLITVIDNYLGFPNASGMDLIKKFSEHFNQYNLPVVKEEVHDIEKKGNSFIVKTDKNKFESKAVILATGRISKKLNVPGENKYYGKGISSCTICDAALFNGKTVSVIGTGDSALHAVLHLSAYAKKIYLLTKYDKLRGDKIRMEKVSNLEKQKKVEVLYQAKVTEVFGDQFLKGIKLEHNKKLRELKLDGVFIEIGMSPETEIIDFIEKNERGEILINSKNETNVKGIFAAGDCTNISEKQLIVAAGEGAKAALSASRYLETLE